ncbi:MULTISPECIES: hypothetical protein [Streptomyces]|uniref:Uncharacterized protein n=1 Tax=Streptomyces griseiscabiei TaxID=2993540 RepID=A0ABU4LM61_9ACTN|nr:MULTISPECIES: hypothetical protein [Streptomyces]MBZ3908546.1 hypothetical protein [Streptomyces griseiscabiei]MDX2916073.1 hypothetical protein [Streptomyces griseiscabiei]
MNEALDAIERQMSRLRTEMRTAAESSDSGRLSELHAQLRSAQDAWSALLGTSVGPSAAAATRPLKSVREQVLQTLTLIGAPASQKTIRTVHDAFFGGALLSSSRMASLRRDEERSFRNSKTTRTYVCPALLTETFRSARSLLVSSEWPLHQRLIASGSGQVNYLTMAVNLADAAAGAGDEAGEDGDAINALLASIALDIPGVAGGTSVSPARIRAAAQRELDRLLPADQEARSQAAKAGAQLDPTEQMFGIAVPQNT